MSTLATSIAQHPEHHRDESLAQLEQIRTTLRKACDLLPQRALSTTERAEVIGEIKALTAMATACNGVIAASDAAAARMMQQSRARFAWLF